ncbi:Hypothetical protein AT6N2_L0467 [Agrobacterium tumefaciens]|nr:Hypothetical protein AT6N2_L0467 [Agrobacterium tumefaciens]
MWPQTIPLPAEIQAFSFAVQNILEKSPQTNRSQLSPEGQNAIITAIILDGAQKREAVGSKYSGNIKFLIETDLYTDNPVFHKKTTCIGGDEAVRRKAVLTSVQRGHRVVVTNLLVERCDDIRSYIGRIRRNYVKATRDFFEPVAAYGCEAFSEAVSGCIFGRRLQRIKGDVAADSGRFWALLQQCQTDRPGAGAHVQNTSAALGGNNFFQRRQQRIDQNFRIRPWLKRFLRQQKIQTMKLAVTENAVNGFATGPTFDHGDDTGIFFHGDWTVWLHHEIGQ